MPCTSATRHVAFVCLGLRVLYPPSKSPPPNVIDNSGAKRVLRTTSRATRIRIPFVSARYVAGHVEHSRETNMNVANGILTRVTKPVVRNQRCMRHLKDDLPANADKVLYVFCDFEITKLSVIPTRRKLMCPTSSVSNISVQGVKTWKATDWKR